MLVFFKKKFEVFFLDRLLFDTKKLFLHNIYKLFYLLTYRGYRHLFGLTVNGQRTWSNAKTAKKLNKTLVIFKEKKLNYYLNNKILKSFIFLSEYLNFFWKKNWYYEWVFAKNHLIRLRRKSKFVKPKFNLLLIKERKVLSFYKTFLKKTKKKANRKKQKIDLGSFYIGFTFGFITFFSKSLKLITSLKKF